jgi:hypothetical protein
VGRPLNSALAAGALWIALWGVLGIAGSASAASIATLYWRMGSAPSTADLYLDNSLGVPLGGLNVVVENATGFDLNSALPGVSPADSVYVVRPLAGVPWDVLVINNTALGVTLVPDGATAFLGTLHGAAPHLVPGETIVPGTGEPAFGASFYTASGVPVFGRIDELPPPECAPVFECLPGSIGGGFSITVPEPVALPAVVTPLLCLACFVGAGVRRRARSS